MQIVRPLLKSRPVGFGRAGAPERPLNPVLLRLKLGNTALNRRRFGPVCRASGKQA
jgi:hypothetical protein